jgi:N-acetylmuramoyl-L-alanine amidase
MALKIVECPSPNHDARPGGAPVDILLMHYTGMKTADEALARLTDPAAKVSAHYTIGRDGRVYRHVPEERRAWHAGVSWWGGERNVNGRSIGIEIVNPGHEFGYIPFTDEQIAALIDLSQGILARHAIPARRVIGHSDVAPARKEDPGELFPWKHLADYGIGVWPSPSPRRVSGNPDISDDLKRYGYGLAPDVDIPLDKVITAFQRHFRPSCMDGIADAETRALLQALLAS